MTRDDIIRLAREAGMVLGRFDIWDAELPDLERFAALVAAAEREACADLAMQGAKENPVMGASACYGVAAAIRARGETK